MKKYFKKISKIKVAALPTFLFIVLCCSLLATFEVLFEDRFFPGNFIGDTNLTYLTKSQAYLVLGAKFEERSKEELRFNSNGKAFQVNLASSSATSSFDQSVETAFNSGRNLSLLENLNNQLRLALFHQQLTPTVNFNVDRQLSLINQQIAVAPQDGSLIVDDNQINIVESKPGIEVDQAALKNALNNYLVSGLISSELPIRSIEPKITTANLQKAKFYLEGAKAKPITLTFEKNSWQIDQKTLVTLLDLENHSDNIISRDKLSNYLQDVADQINQPVKEGQFEFNSSTKRVTSFSASQEGRALDLDQTIVLLTAALSTGQNTTITLPVKIVAPKIQTADVNNLGIKELLGRGVSNFAHSIDNRIFNLSLAASRINGVLVAPGENFSFNGSVGDIDGASGYKPAYVIKSGRTVLDDGGGVCQVSTTIFRAVLNSGLPVVARTAHAYRVGYYEQGFPPGIDATVFSPSVDFIFKNDTEHYVLIQAYRDGLTLYVDLYGTSDGRVAKVSTPVVTNVTPAPPDLRQDDPTLPKGTVKQVDFPATGADVSFSRTVTRAGQTLISETFRSNYKPWQAIYLVGTQ